MRKIQIELTEDEAERLRCEAEKRGLPLGATAHELVVQSLPADREVRGDGWRKALEDLADLRRRQPTETDVVQLLAEVRRERDERP